ncbi:MAG: histidine phosphatase family protein [Dehalococcoidia bacterium]
MLSVDLVAHMDAGDRKQWAVDQNERPLSDLGRRQADALADALASESIDALYSGPALRARQTLEPLAKRLGLPIVVVEGIGDVETWRPPDGWDGERAPNVGAHAAGRAMAALWDMQMEHEDGRVVACSHGHVIPALVSFLIGAHELEGVPEVERRGQWHRVQLDGADVVGVELVEAKAFPA